MPGEVDDKKVCNARLDELAKPNKRLILDLWQNYSYLFTDDRKETIRLLVQEMYAMTPEETQRYFDEISAVVKKLKAREKMRKRSLKRYLAKLNRIERKRALNKFQKIFIQALTYASKNPVPPLVSPRLRNMSDLILDQLCDIRGVCTPERTDNDRQAQFFCNIADWISIAIEYVYYEIHVQKNMEFDIIEANLKGEQESQCMMEAAKKQ
ncbi:hypothetical protein RN001_002600 [Aquatica leii]|uniref:Uncharacterized protein n=1 Tax=Aquatica leii TaxID=1421715 RepID=A0AAN7PH44_9COLE|nr:hypothetical protein RN001_002600 [Aquatica leii]